ncbi:MAG TPA: N-acetyl-1-D-myo-inositol-2-amino-2-deoxy-alpha-D-glucopyranoside deacetylase [Actinomycetes bacterium]|nr:N-acetyl-1-D-myo-inositol-2-amino-2-deoxy-alpha-D-glucopyranoside deacetylase [Actinomycetes bacterium]
MTSSFDGPAAHVAVDVPTGDAATGRRMLLVHAHPDDETISSGITMAKYVAEGVAVTLVTCTRGEEGEVLVKGLEHLAAHVEDNLGEHRERELADAMHILGVSDHRFLGGAGAYRDSGMMGTDSNDRPECFWRADLLEAAEHLVRVIREVRPQVLVTYDQFGQYGHPDHIQAHRVSMYAQLLAAVPTFKPELGAQWEISKVYWTALPKSVIQQGMDAFIEAGGQGFFGLEEGETIPWANEDHEVTTQIRSLDLEPTKVAALRAHETQVEQDGDFFRMSEVVGPEAMGNEFFRLVKGAPGKLDDSGRETDLFAGLGLLGDGS